MLRGHQIGPARDQPPANPPARRYRAGLDEAKRSICVEAKFESGEGAYPSSSAERAEFTRRGLLTVKQTDLQTYLMSELLGYETKFVFLVKSPHAHSKSHSQLSWADAFDALDCSSCPAFIRDWIDSL